MPRALIFLFALLVLAPAPGPAADLVLSGGMDSRMDFAYERDIAFAEPVTSLSLSFVTPESFTSPTYSQKVERFDLSLAPPPDKRTTRRDERGNEIITATWNSPPEKVRVKLVVNAASEAMLKPIETSAPFPLAGVPKKVRPYLRSTARVQSDDPRIRAKAGELTADASTEAMAAKAIVDFVSDHVRYVNPPERFDALYSLETGKGNCQNYSHLAAALMRAEGIPARIVNGFTMDRPYSVARKNTVFTLKGGQGRHSWIEVWFPDLGWVPFDPLKTSLFVSNRYLRVELGVDNAEAKNDGRVLWSRPPNSKARPRLRTRSEAAFPRDEVKLVGDLEPGGARTMVLLPKVRAVARSVPGPASPAPAVAAAEIPAPPPPAAAGKPAPPAKATADLAKPEPEPSAQTPIWKKPAKPARTGPEVPAKPEAPAAPGPADKAEDPLLAALRQLGRVVPGLTDESRAAKPGGRPAPPARPKAPKTPEPAGKTEPERPKQTTEPPPAPAPPKPALRPPKGPVLFGNLDFPENVDFTDYGEPRDMGGGSFELTRNFMVETAQYATSKMTQYAQVFKVETPLDLESVALALHRYGGEGSLWVDVYADAGGQPGELVAASDLKDVETLSFRPGYRWAEFSFARETPRLEPGMYWLGLGFTGDPVVNWYYTPGKPVGPMFGTRYKGVFDKRWSGALDFEFNYRIKGNPPKRRAGG